MWSATVDAKTLLEGKHYRATWSSIWFPYYDVFYLISSLFPMVFLWVSYAFYLISHGLLPSLPLFRCDSPWYLRLQVA